MEKKPKISWANWCRWCGNAVHRQANAGEIDIVYDMAKVIFETCDIVDSGATHHLRIDYEHLWPVVVEDGSEKG